MLTQTQFRCARSKVSSVAEVYCQIATDNGGKSQPTNPVDYLLACPGVRVGTESWNDRIALAFEKQSDLAEERLENRVTWDRVT